jgi:uncharacterized membrane-anchored protein
MAGLPDYPGRYALANELHARPFPVIRAPGHALFLAIKQPHGAAGRDRAADRAHLVELLDRFGATHPNPGSTHFFGELGRHHLKWECHTEFVTYTLFVDGLCERPFDPAAFDALPADWLARAPGHLLASVIVRIETADSDDPALTRRVRDWFEMESVAMSAVADRAALIASDFRIDTTGHGRIAVFPAPGTSPRKLGRIVQRLLEIETYKTMAMLALPLARDLGRRMNTLETRLAELVAGLDAPGAEAEQSLHGLLEISAELEQVLARHSYRFSATEAYAAIVDQRIAVLREERFEGRQSWGEFMTRRFDPAVRTCRAARLRLEALTDRTARAGSLLQARVDVDRQAQNQKLLESMDKRADLQLRLQKTVEGLSVVAISYYAVNLSLFLLGPLEAPLGLDKAVLAALATPPVVLAVWWTVRRIRKGME